MCCVSVCMDVWLSLTFDVFMADYESDSDFCLTQTPSKSFKDTESYSNGNDIVDNDVLEIKQQAVSLEGSLQSANFDLGYCISQPSQGSRFIYDNIETEDIFSD